MSHRRLSDDTVRQIRSLIGTISDSEIARRFGIHRTTVLLISVGLSYGNVPSLRPPLPSRFYPGSQLRYGR